MLKEGRLVKIKDRQHPWHDDIGIIKEHMNGVYWRIEIHGKEVLFPSYNLELIDEHQ
jgi:hypothetical protein